MGMLGENVKVSSVSPAEAETMNGDTKDQKPSPSAAKIKGPVLLSDVQGGQDSESLAVKVYNVEDFYWETGYWQAIAKNAYFGHLTLAVISLNACWIGIDSDHNDAETLADAELPFQVGEHFFAIFFTFEWLARFMSFQSKWNCFKDGWFKFDSALVGLMVGETWIMPLAMGGGGGGMGDVSILRLLRLLRLTRMARLMRAIPELLVLLKGMAAAARSVFSTLVLLILFTYVFAIIFKQQVGENDNLAYFFNTIPEAMWNLLLVGTLLDNITDVLNLLRKEAPVMCAVFLFWVLLSSFTILNMLIGVLCEVVAAVAEAEKEQNVVNYVKDTLLGVLDTFDLDGNRKLSESEFAAFCSHPATKEPLEAIEVDVDNLKSLTDVIFSKSDTDDDEQNPAGEDDGTPISPMAPETPASVGSAAKKRLSQSMSMKGGRELDFGEVLETILELRSSNTAMVKDAVEIRKHIRRIHKADIACFQDMAEDSERMQEVQMTMIQEVKKLAKRNEEIVSTMLVPIAAGVRGIQEQLGIETSPQLTALATRPEPSLDVGPEMELGQEIDLDECSPREIR